MGITEYQRKQYEEAARKYLEDCPYDTDEKLNVFAGIIEGTKIAHSKIEEAEREAWNRAIDEAKKLIVKFISTSMMFTELKEELKKLRK